MVIGKDPVGDRRTISTIMPARSAEPLAADAMDTAGRQTCQDLEPIAVGDRASGGNQAILASRVAARNRPARIFRLVRKADAGGTRARNRDLGLSFGALGAAFVVGSRLYPDRLPRLVETLHAVPDLQTTSPESRHLDETSAPLGFEARACGKRGQAGGRLHG